MSDVQTAERFQVEVDRLIAEREKFIAERTKLAADEYKARREGDYYPIVVLISGLTAGAALFGAGAAFMKFFH